MTTMTTAAKITKPRAKTNALNGKQIFALMNYFQTQREVLWKEKPSRSALSKQLTEKFGFAVTEANIKYIQDSTGVSWEARTRSGKSTKVTSGQNTRVISRAILDLYKQLGVTPPDDLVEIWKRNEGKLGKEEAATVCNV